MNKPYFAMMYNQEGNIAMPIMDSDEDGENERVMFWETEEEVRESMSKHAFARSFGFEIFSMEQPL